MQNSDFSTRISSLYRSQTSTMVLAFKTSWLAPELLVSMGPIPHLSLLQSKQRLLDQNFKSLLSPDLTYGFLHAKTATFGSELQVSMGPWLRLLICECKTACLDPEWHLSIGLSLHLWISAFKTATLASESLVSNAPSPHLWFLHAKQRL